MRVDLEEARAADIQGIAHLRNAAADHLTAWHGRGVWSGQCTARGVDYDRRRGTLYVVRGQDEVIATLMLSRRKPWAIDVRTFSAVRVPLYLTSMAVAPSHQRQGLGRACLASAARIARSLEVEAIRLDSYDHAAAGAGPFYLKCGYVACGRGRCRGVALRYFEKLL